MLSGSEQNNSLYWFRPVLVSFASLPVRRASRIYTPNIEALRLLMPGAPDEVADPEQWLSLDTETTGAEPENDIPLGASRTRRKQGHAVSERSAIHCQRG
jgi:hypothetical protein